MDHRLEWYFRMDYQCHRGLDSRLAINLKFKKRKLTLIKIFLFYFIAILSIFWNVTLSTKSIEMILMFFFHQLDLFYDIIKTVNGEKEKLFLSVFNWRVESSLLHFHWGKLGLLTLIDKENFFIVFSFSSASFYSESLFCRKQDK